MLSGVCSTSLNRYVRYCHLTLDSVSPATTSWVKDRSLLRGFAHDDAGLILEVDDGCGRLAAVGIPGDTRPTSVVNERGNRVCRAEVNPE